MAQPSIRTYDGLRPSSLPAQRGCSGFSTVQMPLLRRERLVVEANKRVLKKQQVILRQGVSGLGEKGVIVKVPNGYFRNYLRPRGLAVPVTEGILGRIEKEKRDAENTAREVKAKAKAMAVALQTIGKFIIKKKAGENNQIYGSVTTAEVVEAIAQQTGRTLDKKAVELPEIKEVGTYDASIKLHPEVVGTFKIVVQREKNVG
eukprot:jgi/Botrbrau1/21014/Bobra.0144s0028.1